MLIDSNTLGCPDARIKLLQNCARVTVTDGRRVDTREANGEIVAALSARQRNKTFTL